MQIIKSIIIPFLKVHLTFLLCTHWSNSLTNLVTWPCVAIMFKLKYFVGLGNMNFRFS